jgi:hypothetical protein
MTNDDRRLDALLARYRAACPDPDPSVDFMPRLWARIEAPRSLSFVFQRLGRFLLTGAAAACLLMGGLNMMPRHTSVSSARTGYATYIDALSADITVERTYYSEFIPPTNSAPPEYEQ